MSRYAPRSRFLVALLLVSVGLAACSFAPLPISVDLLKNGALPGTSGSFELVTPAGLYDLSDSLGAFNTGTLGPFTVPFSGFEVDVVRLAAQLGLAVIIPDAAGFLLDFSDRDIPVAVTEVSLGYVLDLNSRGAVSGELALQPYLAPVGTGTLIAPAYTLGQPQQVKLAGDTRLESIVSLNAAQLRGVNEGSLRLAIAVVGGSLRFNEPGQVGIDYTLSRLTLNVGAVNARVREQIPGSEGELLDFSEQDVPFGRIVSLGFDYAVQLELDEPVTGNASLQLYIAPADAADLFAPAYAFGVLHSLDLSQPRLVIADRAELAGAQQDILQDKRLRLGILITGEAGVALGEPVRVTYQFTKLELFGGYSLN